IEEPSLPDFKVYQRPQSFRVVLARVVPRPQFANEARLEYATLKRPWTQHILIDNVAELVSKPRSYWHRETHLPARQNLLWQAMLHSFSQNVFRRQPAKLHLLRQ